MSDISIAEIRSQFPVLKRKINDNPLVYFDNAASAQKPRAVIEAMSHHMENSYANVHRGLHTLANESTDAFEKARQTVARYLGAAKADEIVFTKGGTEALNLIASCLSAKIKPGDEIVLSVMEHHSNIVPWHFMRERLGAKLKWVPILDNGALDMEALKKAITAKTRIVTIAHMSNVLGTLNPVKQIAEIVHKKGAMLVVDGCQGAVHTPVNVQELGADFYVMTGHKLYGPSGIGALFGRYELLKTMRPYQGGGEMIDVVAQEDVIYGKPPQRFEAGTPPIIEAVGLGAAIEWIASLDQELISHHKQALVKKAHEVLKPINGLRIHGETLDKGPVVSFSVQGVHPHDLAQILDQYGIAIRAGHHCAAPLMEALGETATARASFGIYNTLEEVEIFGDRLSKALHMLL